MPQITPAPFASRPDLSRGRLHAEPESAARSPFQRDRDRIIHSAAFRRLEHKTQVFVHHEGDHYRSRLTHSLEVAQIARSVSRELGLNEDLAEALALAHDLGHTPFGHAGEDALSAAMKPYGGFDHNAHTLRIVVELEGRYAAFDGLNLTWETLEGIVKHNGPMDANTVPETISRYLQRHDLEIATHAGPEAQVAALADDIAYNNHDIDDGLRAGLLTVDDFADVPMVGPVFHELRKNFPDLDTPRLVHEAIRRLINAMVTDLVAETRARIARHAPRTVEEVRGLSEPIAAFSTQMQDNDRSLKEFLFENMYRHFRLNRMASKARRVLTDLFDLLLSEPQCLPTVWYQRANGAGTPVTARLVADYIAGMTDRYALKEHARLFDLSAQI
ncbi:MAG: deoxyguanosinetriphosphate triphosphohydrolase [Alphaproteobacteria bacterium]